MKDTGQRTEENRKVKFIIVAVLVVVLLLAVSVFAVRHVYESNLRPVSDSQEIILVDIPQGATPHEIATTLEEKGVIRKGWAFEWYIRNVGARDQLKAGTYELAPSLGVKQVVNIITQGEVATDLITILPGQRLGEISESLVSAGFDRAAVESALEADSYGEHPALVDKPTDATLEGYIYPESFQITTDTTPSVVVEASLDQLQDRLTPELRAQIVKRGLTVHEGITLASIIEREGDTSENRKQIAQVFFKRLNEGIKLEADATTRYATGNHDRPLTRQELNESSPYNTRRNQGLPPGPISNFSESSLEAVAYPAEGDYLFFVTGDDGVTRFSRTIAEHERLIDRHGVSGE
ncbi:MAG: endolytic transglycosylase MltG [Candidatus Saccharibacteria bacterium]|nr:endolytic transglycosylase MltG [Candidatus Saccharibacteria bacterium]